MQKHLTAVLGGHSGWTVCAAAANGVSAILMAHELKPDLVILDLVMPTLDGADSDGPGSADSLSKGKGN